MVSKSLSYFLQQAPLPVEQQDSFFAGHWQAPSVNAKAMAMMAAMCFMVLICG